MMKLFKNIDWGFLFIIGLLLALAGYVQRTYGQEMTKADSTERWEQLIKQGVDTAVVYVSFSYEWKIIDYIDPFSWGEGVDKILRKACPAFRYKEMPRTDKAFIENIIADKTDKWRVDVNALADSANEPDLVEKFQTKNRMIMKHKFDFKKIIKDKKDVVLPKIKDEFAWSIGDSLVGSGGAWATFALCYADIDAGGFTGNATATLISSVTETGQSAITEDLNGYSFICDSNNPHNGDPTKGWLVSINYRYDTFVFTHAATGGGTVEIKNLRLKDITARTGGWRVLDINSAAACSVKIHCNMYDGAGQGGWFSIIEDNTPTINICNNVIWDVSVGIASAVNLDSGSPYENNSVYDASAYGFYINGRITTLKNNVAINCTVADFHNPGGAVGNNNASSDATAGDFGSGANNQINITIANEFPVVDDTNSEFLKVASGGVLWDGGIAGISTLGIRGNARGVGGTYSIGADEYEADDDKVGIYDKSTYHQKAYNRDPYNQGIYFGGDGDF